MCVYTVLGAVPGFPRCLCADGAREKGGREEGEGDFFLHSTREGETLERDGK